MSPAALTGLREFSLSNGLSVVLAPSAESPTTSVWVWYRVGSKNERPGLTGASHWVEHMLFQGSPKFAKGEIDRAIVEVGGTLNAFTDVDFTAYLSTVPREHGDVPLGIEADRMTRALMDPEEVARERAVILSEREGNENWPEFKAEEELYHLAFSRHPYRWDPLGYPEDIRRLSAPELADYYHRFYGTRNAVLVVSGGFDPIQMARRVRKDFGRLPASGEDPTVRIVEPPPHGERRAALAGPGTTPFLVTGWRAPGFEDPATPATVLLDVILGGETRLFAAGSAWGRSAEHPTSRLYRGLVDTGLAVRATSEGRPREHPGLFTVHAQAAAGVPLEKLEAAIDKEIDRLVRDGPNRTELAEAKAKVRRGAELAYEGSTRIAFRLGYFAIHGGLARERRLLRLILATSARTVRAQAAALFRRDRRAVVTYEPTRGIDSGE